MITISDPWFFFLLAGLLAVFFCVCLSYYNRLQVNVHSSEKWVFFGIGCLREVCLIVLTNERCEWLVRIEWSRFISTILESVEIECLFFWLVGRLLRFIKRGFLCHYRINTLWYFKTWVDSFKPEPALFGTFKPELVLSKLNRLFSSLNRFFSNLIGSFQT